MYGDFTSEISLTPLRGPKGEWRVNDKFAWHVGEKGSNYHALIEAGFVYDLASVPWIGEIVVPHTTAPQASALHDKGYQDNELWIVSHWRDGVPIYHENPIAADREFWDLQFMHAMRVLEVPEYRVQAAYAGVRAGGWKAWNKHRKNDARKQRPVSR